MRFVLVILLGASMSACTPAAASHEDVSPRALELLERTKQVTETYAVYNWNWITLHNQEPTEEWSAEFHSGHLHRVETPIARVVADCQKHNGYSLFLPTGKIVEGPEVAAAACGIATNAQFTAAEWLSVVQTSFGEAQRIRITDQELIREYDISEEGVLLRTTYTEINPRRKLLLKVDAVALENTLPSADMFDKDSLSRSFVPDRFRETPEM